MVDTVRTLSYFQSVLHPNIPNAVPDATVLEAQAARDLLISIGSFLGVVTVGPSGQYPATFAGINAAIVAANAAGGGHIMVAGGLGAIVYAGTSITPLSNVWLDIQPGTWLETSSTGAQILINGENSNIVGAGKAFTGTVAEGTLAGTITSGNEGCAKDDLVGIERDGVNPWQVMKVHSVVGSAFTFYDSFEWSYNTNWKLHRVANVIQNFKFSGEMRNPVNTTTAVRGIVLWGFENPIIENVTASGFGKSVLLQQDAIALFICYNARISKAVLSDCGTGIYGGLQAGSCSHLNIDRVMVRSDIGQPTVFVFNSDMNIDNSVFNGLGRVLEFETCRRVKIDGVSVTCSDITTGNCVALEGGVVATYGAGFNTRHVTISNCDFNGAVIALNVFDNTNQDILVENTKFTNNTTDISVPTSNINVHIMPTNQYTVASITSLTCYTYKWEPVNSPAVVVRQSGSLASIANSYVRVFKQKTRVDFELTVSVLDGTGAIAGNVIEVSLPGPNADATAASGLVIIGSGEIRDNSTGFHHPVIVALSSTAGRMVLLDSTQAIAVYQGGAGSTMAAIALAVNDVISLSGSYEVP